MENINEILARAAALRDETALNSISPARAGGIMYDTLLALNELWLQQGSALVISKIYASVAAMNADTAPVSDLTGQPIRPGMIVCIASSDSDNGSVYRYNGSDSPSWSLVGKIGNIQPIDNLTSDSASDPLAAHQGKVLDGKISQLGQKEQINKNDCYLTSITGLEITLSTMDYSTSVPTINETDQVLDFYGDIYDVSNPSYKLMCVDVVPGEVYHIQGNTSPFTNAQVALYNGANKVAYFSADNSIDRIIYIPSGVNKLYVQKAFSYGNIEKITNLHSKGIDELNNKVSNDELGIEYNYNRLSQISSPSGTTVASQTIYENKYLDFDGNIQNVDNTFLVGVTSVTPGHRYQLKYIGYMTNCGYAFVDSQGTILKKEVIEISYTAVERNVMAPYGAAELRVSYITGNTFNVLEESNTFVLKPTIWSTKKWTVVGDSLTERTSAATKFYYDYIQEKTGIEIANMGASGTGYKRGYEGDNAFYQRISSVPLDTDVITIFGSFNDNPYFNNIGQITDTGTETLCGCVNTCLDNLFSVLPLANVGIVSPTPWKTAVPGQGDVERYVKMLHDICELRGIPYLDLFHCSSLRPWEASYRALCYSRDGDNGVHLDENGYKIIAPRFEDFLKTLLLC